MPQPAAPPQAIGLLPIPGHQSLTVEGVFSEVCPLVVCGSVAIYCHKGVRAVAPHQGQIMQQTFMRFVATDLPFWLSSLLAVAWSMALPVGLTVGGFALAAGPRAAAMAAAAAGLWLLADRMLLMVRMAGRIALGREDANALLDRSVLGNAAYLHGAYFAASRPAWGEAALR